MNLCSKLCHVCLNPSKASFLSTSVKHYSYFDSTSFRSTESISLLGFFINSFLFVLTPSSRVARKVDFLFRARGILHPSPFVIQSSNPPESWMLESFVRRSFVYLFFSSLSGSTKSRAVGQWYISALKSHAPRRAAASLSFFYRYYSAFCYSELALAVPWLQLIFRWLIILSKFSTVYVETHYFRRLLFFGLQSSGTPFLFPFSKQLTTF